MKLYEDAIGQFIDKLDEGNNKSADAELGQLIEDALKAPQATGPMFIPQYRAIESQTDPAWYLPPGEMPSQAPAGTVFGYGMSQPEPGNQMMLIPNAGPPPKGVAPPPPIHSSPPRPGLPNEMPGMGGVEQFLQQAMPHYMLIPEGNDLPPEVNIPEGE